MMSEKSKSIPFLNKAPALAGIDSPAEFDPLGLSSQFDIRWLQEAEIKHSRVAMLATAGYVFADTSFQLPDHDYSSLAAHDIAVKSGAGFQILLVIHLAELFGSLAVKEMYEGSGREPGSFGFDPLNLSKGNSKKYAEKELQNGRLAMLAISGILTQAVLTGKGFPYY